MTLRENPIPVVLLVYARSTHLARTLACLRENQVPLILAFADGAKGPSDAAAVAQTRALLRAVDWCEVRLTERPVNLGLGRNLLAAVSEVAKDHDAYIVWEDDLICVPGTYAWVCAALRRYAADCRVMSVTAWTHPRVTPNELGDSPYFDARAECWVWGAWSRSWVGMEEESAMVKLASAAAQGAAPDAYGGDLPIMAESEARQNTWAVRWIYHHLQHHGLCVRPPWSLVEHIGFDETATNAASAKAWANPPLRPAPSRDRWPEPRENPAVRKLWQSANAGGIRGLWRRLRAKFSPA